MAVRDQVALGKAGQRHATRAGYLSSRCHKKGLHLVARLTEQTHALFLAEEAQVTAETAETLVSVSKLDHGFKVKALTMTQQT